MKLGQVQMEFIFFSLSESLTPDNLL